MFASGSRVSFFISIRTTSSLPFMFSKISGPDLAIVASKGIGESSTRLSRVQNFPERHSIFPISSMTMSPVPGSNRDNSSRNASKDSRSTPYFPTRYRLLISTCESTALRPSRLTSSKPVRFPPFRISLVINPLGLCSPSVSRIFSTTVVLPLPGFPVTRRFFFFMHGYPTKTGGIKQFYLLPRAPVMSSEKIQIPRRIWCGIIPADAASVV